MVNLFSMLDLKNEISDVCDESTLRNDNIEKKFSLQSRTYLNVFIIIKLNLLYE